MTGIYPTELQRVLTFLPRGRFQFLLKKLGPPKPIPLEPKAVLVLTLYDWFAHLGGYISDDQQQRVVAQFDAELGKAVSLPQDRDDMRLLPAVVLTLSDGRYAAVTGREHWYDYEQDEDRMMLLMPSVTHISCDLTALQLRVRRRVQELRGGKDAAADRRHDPPGRPANG